MFADEFLRVTRMGIEFGGLSLFVGYSWAVQIVGATMGGRREVPVVGMITGPQVKPMPGLGEVVPIVVRIGLRSGVTRGTFRWPSTGTFFAPLPLHGSSFMHS